MNILDQYVVRAPSEQNVLDLFEGEWSSRMPASSKLISNPGTAALFDDARIVWAEQQLGSFDGADILELGPLEAGHTYMMHERGARSIIAIEANSRAFLKCLCVKQLFDLSRAKFLLGDFLIYLRERTSNFDFVVASGVLYHMQQPMEFLDLICSASDRLFIWTHYYDERIISSNKAIAKKFATPHVSSYQGFEYQAAQQSYHEALNWAGFCGGPEAGSTWLTRDSILEFLEKKGFHVSINFEQTTHPNGPAFAICAKKQ